MDGIKNKTFVFGKPIDSAVRAPRALIHSSRPRATSRERGFSAKLFRLILSSPVLLTLILSGFVVPMAAFEAHVINVTATIERRACQEFIVRSKGYWHTHDFFWEELLPQTLGNDTVSNFEQVEDVFTAHKTMRDRVRAQLITLKFNISFFGAGGAFVPGENITLSTLAAQADALLSQEEASKDELETMKDRLDRVNNSETVNTCPEEESPPTLRLIKLVINDDGGELQPSDFPLFINDTLALSGETYELAPGTYTVSETQQDGYDFAGFFEDCNEGVVTLEPGDEKVCVLKNNDIEREEEEEPVDEEQNEEENGDDDEVGGEEDENEGEGDEEREDNEGENRENGDENQEEEHEQGGNENNEEGQEISETQDIKEDGDEDSEQEDNEEHGEENLNPEERGDQGDEKGDIEDDEKKEEPDEVENKGIKENEGES